MYLLIDQDVYRVTVDLLKEWGHDVVTAKELGMHRASDEELLRKAREMIRIFVTRDKDFGAIVFLKETLSVGVILLRVNPITVEEVHKELRRVFQEHTEEELYQYFCVVEPYRHRLLLIKQ